MFRGRTQTRGCHRHWSAPGEIQVSCNAVLSWQRSDGQCDNKCKRKLLRPRVTELLDVCGWLERLTGRVTGRLQAGPPSPLSPRSRLLSRLSEIFASHCLSQQGLGRGCVMLANPAPSPSRTTMSQVNQSCLCFTYIHLGLLEGQEDCLYINVYRPEAEEEEEENEPQELLPVSWTMNFFSAKQDICRILINLLYTRWCFGFMAGDSSWVMRVKRITFLDHYSTQERWKYRLY